MSRTFPATPDNSASSAPVLRSWQRCMARESDMQPDPVTLVRSELGVRLEQHASLLQAAQPEIDTLSTMVGRNAGIVLLADASGIILQTAGNASFLHQAERVALHPGVSWAEQHRGTNAIGTALLEHKPVRVHGAEHYLHCNRILSCHGAPVLSPRGDLLGVLDISGDAGHLHGYALGLATLCSRLITNRMMQQSRARRELLVFQRQPALLDSTERALLLLDDGRIVGANDVALTLLRASWQELLDQPALGWVGEWRMLDDDIAKLRAPSGELFYASLFRDTSVISQRSAAPPPGRETRASATTPLPDAAPATSRQTRSSPQPADAHRTSAIPPATPGTTSATSDTPSQTASRLHPSVTLALAPQIASRFDAVRRAFDGGLGVFLHGETGVGKEIYARQLHAASRWHTGPFVAVNCGALPESLIEAELFGYEAGAFTGARRGGARGRLREADGGVLFLDEIGDMPLALQTRLLRALQERAVQPLGSDRLVPVEFGLISATHRDIGALVQTEQFRNDLFYRLHDLRVNLPPLRDRTDLRSYLCSALRATAGDAMPLTLDDGALDYLTAHRWPGNYRELHALLRTLVVMNAPGSVIRHEDIVPYLRGMAMPLSVDADLKDGPAEKPATAMTISDSNGLRGATAAMMTQALEACGGNVTRAARQLGIHRSTLYRHLCKNGS